MENFIFCAVSKDQSAEITARVASVAFHFWLPFTINRVFNWTRLTNIVRDHFCRLQLFRGPINTAQVIYDALHDLVPFAQFKKRENHPWRSVTFSKVAGSSLKFY